MMLSCREKELNTMKQEMLRMGILTALITTALTGAAWAMPSGGTLAQGNVTVDQGSLSAVTSGATIKATEDSVIDWTEFDLAAVDELHFDTLNGAIINRVPAGKAALLRGKITQVGTHPLTIICDGGLSTDGARIDGTDVEIDASKMTMQNSGITASRVRIRVGESEKSAGTYHLRSTTPLYLSNTFICAQKVRSMSGAICLLKDSELSADHINLSIGADIRISYGAEGAETQEEISLSARAVSVSGGTANSVRSVPSHHWSKTQKNRRISSHEQTGRRQKCFAEWIRASGRRAEVYADSRQCPLPRLRPLCLQ